MLAWVGLHDLRHFRVTQWVSNGVDLRTVQEWLGHSDIQTTMRYAHYAKTQARRSFDEVEKIEEEQNREIELKVSRGTKVGRQQG